METARSPNAQRMKLVAGLIARAAYSPLVRYFRNRFFRATPKKVSTVVPLAYRMLGVLAVQRGLMGPSMHQKEIGTYNERSIFDYSLGHDRATCTRHRD